MDEVATPESTERGGAAAATPRAAWVGAAASARMPWGAAGAAPWSGAAEKLGVGRTPGARSAVSSACLAVRYAPKSRSAPLAAAAVWGSLSATTSGLQ